MNPLELVADLGRLGQTHTGWVLGGLAALPLLGGAAALARRGRQEQATHGSAQFATLRQATAAGLRTGQGVSLGTLDKKELWASGRHVVICAPPDSGKDTCHNFPTTLTWPGSMVIVDAKDGGENYALCKPARQQRGPVYRFSPGQRVSVGYNLLSGVRVGVPEEFRDVTVLVEGLIAPKKRGQFSTDSGAFFEHKGVSALRAVILHVLHSRPNTEASLATCHQLMADPAPLLEAMQASRHPEVRQQALRLQHLMTRGERQFEGEWGTAQGVLDLFGDPLITRHTAQSDFHLLDLQYGPRPVTLYLGAEGTTDLQYLYPLYRSLLHLLYRQLSSVGQRHAARRWPLLVLLNEFPQLGYMKILEDVPAVSRSTDIWFVLVLQDLEQLWSTYGRDTPLWGTMGVQVFHAPNNDQTAKRLSEMLGPTTITVESISQGDRRSRNRHPAARLLMTPAEVRGMGADTVLIWAQGCAHPIKGTKAPYYKDRRCAAAMRLTKPLITP